MSLSKDFWKQLPLRADRELYDMLAHQDDYLPEALAAAKDELSKRNLAPKRMARLPAAETFWEAFQRGVRLRPFEPSDLPAEFQARLLEVCRADPNVAGVWLMWWVSRAVSHRSWVPLWFWTGRMSARFAILLIVQTLLAARVSSQRSPPAFRAPSPSIGEAHDHAA